MRTGQRTPLKTLAPAHLADVHSLFRVDITPDGGHYVYPYWRELSDLYLVEGIR